jgi:transcriptional regulator with XRE-family HTH domain
LFNTTKESALKIKMSKADVADRNKKIIEMSRKGLKQSEIAKEFGVSSQRISQIMSGFKINKTKKKTNEPREAMILKSKNELIEAIVLSNMDSDLKLELLKLLKI